MTGAEQTALFNEYLARMAGTRETKNLDYANEVDSLANFRLSEKAGIPAWIGLLTRLGDKFARASEVARKVINGQEPSFAVVEEGFEDLAVDGANYFLLMGIAFQEWKQSRYEMTPNPSPGLVTYPVTARPELR